MRELNKNTHSQEEVIRSFVEKHGVFYNYDNVLYIKASLKVKIGCPIHGYFEQTPVEHKRGKGCPECGKEKNRKSNLDKNEWFKNTFKERASEKHNNFYDYSKTECGNKAQHKVIITCPIHGDFEQQASNHLQGMGCMKCGHRKTKEAKEYTKNDFEDLANKVHNHRFDYSNTIYVDSATKVEIVCKKHGVFKQKPYSHLQGHACPICSDGVSQAEKEVRDYLIFNEIEIESNKRGLIGKNELDIFIPSKNIAIEYNGLYWHSEERLGKTYHLDKTLKAKEAGIKLIHIFEDEWLYKRDIVESRLLNILGKTPNKIYARECEIREVNESVAEFLDKNHLQGKVGSKIKLGLYYKNELVSLMTFGDLRKNLGSKKEQDVYEMIRFCNRLNTNVIGSASKLLKHFIENYTPKEIISYADRRWSEGELYEKLQFELVSETVPNYFYTKGNKREARFKYRKDILVSEGFDPNKSEKQIMEERGYKRIYDCGTLKYTLKTK